MSDGGAPFWAEDERPSSSMLQGTAHSCGQTMECGKVYICQQSTITVPRGYQMFMVPKYPMVHPSVGGPAACDACGGPIYVALFGSTQWN